MMQLTFSAVFVQHRKSCSKWFA